MLSDRSYMRSPAGRSAPGFLAVFLGLLAGVFVLQNIASIWFRSDAFFTYGALDASALRSGLVWTLLTYALLHGSLTHLLVNGLGLFFIGRALRDELGPRSLAAVTVWAALGGGLAWLGVNFARPGYVVGASAIVMAYLTVYACLHPRRPFTMLLFFIVPVTVQPIWVVTVFAALDVFGLLFQELPNSRNLYGVAHSAHLGGLAAGWIFYQLVIVRGFGSARSSIEPPAWFRRRASTPAPPAGPASSSPTYTVNLGTTSVARVASGSAGARPAAAASSSPAVAGLPTQRDLLRAESDRILDKISLHGVGSLTAEEKRVLDQVSKHLNPR